MSLASILPHLPRERKSAKACALGTAVSAMETKDREALEQALGDLNLSAFVLSEALRRSGYDISDQMVRRHRNGLCMSCRKS